MPGRPGGDAAGSSGRRLHADRGADGLVRARSHAAGRAFGKAIHGEHADVDGLVYESRLTGEEAYAVFDRGIGKLEARGSGALQTHPALPAILTRQAIKLVR